MLTIHVRCLHLMVKFDMYTLLSIAGNNYLSMVTIKKLPKFIIDLVNVFKMDGAIRCPSVCSTHWVSIILIISIILLLSSYVQCNLFICLCTNGPVHVFTHTTHSSTC